MSRESDRRTEGADKAPSAPPPKESDTGKGAARQRPWRRFALDRLRRDPERQER